MTHRNKKPYECKAEGCGKSYCDARSLRRHTENHHSGIITPQNQTLSPTSGTPNGLSLSPAQQVFAGWRNLYTYIHSTGGTVVDAATGITLTEEQIKAINLPLKTGVTLLSPTSTSSASSASGVSLPASSPTIALTETSLVDAGEGLTREQLDLISKIMQQTKQTSAQREFIQVDTNPSSAALGLMGQQHGTSGTASRPRTWNMQLLNTAQNVSISVDETNSDTSSTAPIEAKEEEINQQFVTAINPHLLNIVKMDQKQVECNLCHHPETKKNEKKEPSGPPLQTASIGVRALIEEKIISKRKDMNKGAFVVPAPPSSVSSTSTIRRSISDLESFLSPKSHNNNNNNNNNNSSSNGSNSNSTNQSSSTASTTTAMLPSAATIKNYNGGTLGLQQIGMSHGIEIFSTKQQDKNTGSAGHGMGLGLSAALQANNATMNTSTMKSTATTTITTTTKGTSTDPKDSTLIELLKRGTRIAVTAKKPINSTNTITNMGGSSSNNGNGNGNGNGGSRQIITNNNRTVIIPSDVQILPTRKTSASNSSRSAAPASLADTMPLSLTIAQNGTGGRGIGGDVYTVTYSSDGTGFFEDADVYNVADTDMLLQTVDSMQLLNDDSQQLKSEHSEQFGTVTGVGIQAEGDQNDNNGNCIQAEYLKLQAEGSMNAMPTTTLPTFQQFHSKELIMQNSAQIQAVTSMRNQTHQLGTISSPINSPLAYPTPFQP
ncbi:unnamed protein product [Ceratitis capitata]|uniref:(Mediterranean fruit fly) hypothetical protein n=1 Tax=Ceratitis capitata TaxID=7213 RepID=A0A811U724_CERCA|nr:unnamed protein product [Ceratitis capitata]